MEEVAPTWCNYVRKFREHPAIQPYCMHPEVHKKQAEACLAAAGKGSPMRMAQHEGYFDGI